MIDRSQPFDILDIGTYNPNSFKEGLSTIKEEDWDKYTYRQDNNVGIHSDTKTIPILYDEKYGFNKGKQSVFYSIFENSLVNLEKDLKTTLGPLHIIRAVMVNLFAGKKVTPHYDSGPAMRLYDRIHFPLVTHPDVIFICGETSMNMKVGNGYIIDNTGKIHGVENNSDVDRIHLIVDVHYIKEGLI